MKATKKYQLLICLSAIQCHVPDKVKVATFKEAHIFRAICTKHFKPSSTVIYGFRETNKGHSLLLLEKCLICFSRKRNRYLRKGKIVKEHFLTASNITTFTKHFTINHQQC